MQENIKERIIKLKTNILRARFNLMFMLILSAINILSVVSGNEAFMPFSVTISTFAAKLGVKLSGEQNNELFLYLGIAISAMILLSVLLCYFKSKQNVLFFVVALGIVSIDTLVLLVIGIGGFFYTSFVVDLFIHVITIIFLVSALKSHKELGVLEKFTLDAMNLSDSNSDEIAPEQTTAEWIDDHTEDSIDSILCGEYNGLKVHVVLYEDRAELIINDGVCDVADTSYSSEYELCATVNGIEFNFQYTRTYSGETAYLYAGNELLDSFATDFF